MLAYNQINLVLRNRTTIEHLDFKDDEDLELMCHNKYDMGWLENTKQILGDDIYKWWLPQPIKGNGYNFETTNPLGI